MSCVNLKKIKKKQGGSMVQGQVFLKEGCRVGVALFLFSFFKVYHFLDLEITSLFAKLCNAFEEKLFFSTTVIL